MNHWLFWSCVGYFSGSIPFSWLMAWANGVDLRRVGSGNIGATNAGRALGKRWGATCLVLDAAKGACPVFLAGWVLGYFGQELTHAQAWRWISVAAMAVLGHVYPLWLRFKGGKGVATGLGAMLGFWPMVTAATAAALIMWLLIARVSRYVSLASMAAVGSLPIFLLTVVWVMGKSPVDVAPFLVITASLAGLVIVRHRSNIARLLAGTEPRIHRHSDQS